MANDSCHTRNHKQYLYLLCGINHGQLEVAKVKEIAWTQLPELRICWVRVTAIDDREWHTWLDKLQLYSISEDWQQQDMWGWVGWRHKGWHMRNYRIWEQEWVSRVWGNGKCLRLTRVYCYFGDNMRNEKRWARRRWWIIRRSSEAKIILRAMSNHRRILSRGLVSRWAFCLLPCCGKIWARNNHEDNISQYEVSVEVMKQPMSL